MLEAVRPALADLGRERSIEARAPAGIGPDGHDRVVCLPVADDGEVLGAAAVLVPGPLSEDCAEGAAFLCRHLGLALTNLGRLRKVEHLAYLDDLTHLYNTRYLEVALQRELGGGRPFSVLFMDLDHFKAVNDQHGHLSGSRLLVEVGRVLRACVREEDVIVRYGGDEYVVHPRRHRLGRRAQGGRADPPRDRGPPLPLARGPARARDRLDRPRELPGARGAKAELLDLADRAMYRGKRSTRNVVYMASKDLPPIPAGHRERERG